MSSEPNKIDRRRFLALGAVSGVGALMGAEPANAADPPTVLVKPIDLPEKVFHTAAAGISRRTHEEHYELYKGYVAKANEIRTRLNALTVADQGKSDAIYSELRELKIEYTFALGGVKNHELYFNHIGGTGGEPLGPCQIAINNAFGSFENWKADLRATALAARGWAWLAYDYTDNTLFNYIGDSQNTFPVWHAVPILGLDVHEHAYYLDFGRDRAKYIDAFFDSLDWVAVGDNYKTVRYIADALGKPQ